MRSLLGCLGVGLACLYVGSANASANQFTLFLERADGLQFEKQHDYLNALVRFKVLLILLEQIQKENPTWNHDLVAKDAADSKAKIAELEPLASQEILNKEKRALSSGAPISALYDAGVKEPDALKAMHELEEYLITLEVWHKQDPLWEAGLIEDRIEKSQEIITSLVPKVLKDLSPKPGDGHTIQ